MVRKISLCHKWGIVDSIIGIDHAIARRVELYDMTNKFLDPMLKHPLYSCCSISPPVEVQVTTCEEDDNNVTSNEGSQDP